MDLPAALEHFAVELEEVAVRQPALGVALRRPRIAEIDVKAVHFTLTEKFGQNVRVCVNKADVSQPLGGAALHRDHHRVGHHLDRDEQHVRLRGGGAGGEAALAAAELHAQLARLGHQLAPAALLGDGVLDLIRRAALHARHKIFFLSHSHGKLPRFLRSFPVYHNGNAAIKQVQNETVLSAARNLPQELHEIVKNETIPAKQSGKL